VNHEGSSLMLPVLFHRLYGDHHEDVNEAAASLLFPVLFPALIFHLGGLKDDTGKTEMISVIFVRQNGGNKETI